MTRFQFAVIVLLLFAILAAQVWQIVDDSRPVIRPGSRPKLAPTSRSPLYERFHNPEAMNLVTLT